MRTKDPTVDLRFLCSEIVCELFHIEQIVRWHNTPQTVDMVITSGNDGKHKQSSKHYDNAAIDIRIWNMKHPEQCVTALAQFLGPDFDVILEFDHIHLEYDPK